MTISNDALFYGAVAIFLVFTLLSTTTKARIYNLMTIPVLLVMGVMVYESVPFLILIIGTIMFELWYALIGE
jgi:ABC-type methionine transport system permease subunit